VIRRRLLPWSAAAIGALLLAGCGAGGQSESRSAAQVEESSTVSTPEQAHPARKSVPPPPSAPLRAGERFLDLAMPAAYSPEAPTASGTDDYRCFLLDPELVDPAFITGVDVVPGQPEIVHHVILFRVPAEQVPVATAADQATDGQGWTCFGGTGLDAGDSPGGDLSSAPWVGAWAPGGGESMMAPDIGIPLEAGSRIVMQVHYNLAAGNDADASQATLRLADGSAGLEALETVLLPGPVELACRAEHSDGPLCSRDAALFEVMERFGEEAGTTAAGLQLLCDGDFASPQASPVQTCDRRIQEPTTVRAAAGHMHLLGTSIKIEVNAGTDTARTLLDVPVWDFDNQKAQPLPEPVVLQKDDVVRVTCEHDQAKRDMLPAFEGKPDRYVLWGEGTTDEMCLGILMVTHP